MIDDYQLKPSMLCQIAPMWITGSNLRTNHPNIPPKDIQAGHEFMDRSLKSR
jgi:hypothetical protein